VQLNAHQLAIARKQQLQIVLIQIVAAFIVASGYAILVGWRAAVSALIGGAIAAIAAAGSAVAMLREQPDRNPAGMATRFFLGWAMKVLFTITLLVIAFRSQRLTPLPLLCGYVATLLVYGIAAARVTKLPQVRRD
jgi:ATP synthase protein I